MIQDFRFAFRSLARRKGLLALAITTRALGVGASTALFSMVNGVLLRPLPYRSPERLAILWHVFGHGAQDLPAMHPPDYRDYRDRSKTLEDLTIATGQQLILGGDAHPQIVQVGSVAAHFFTFLGVDPQLGRHFLPQEDVPGGPRVAIISPRSVAVSLWWRSGRCRADGRTELAARGDRRRPAAWVPARAAGRDICTSRLGRLAAGADQLHAAAAQESDRVYGFRAAGSGCELRAGAGGAERIAGQLRAEVAEHKASELRVKVIPFLHDVVKGARSGLWMLMAAVGLVLAIACVNGSRRIGPRASITRLDSGRTRTRPGAHAPLRSGGARPWRA